MNNLYFLRVAIKICGGRRQLAASAGFKEDRISEWLNETRKISLKNAIKIEEATHGQVTRAQLVSDTDKKFKHKLKTEVQIIQQSRPPLTFKDRVALGLAHEAVLGCRKGVRSDLLLRENFPEVPGNSNHFSSEKPILQGRTEEIAADLAGFSNYKTYQQAKKIVKNGISELSEAVDRGLPIFRAFRMSEFSPEKQHYFLSLDESTMIQALNEAVAQRGADKWKQISNGSNVHAENNGEAVAAWALVSFNATLFQNKNTKRMRDKEKPIGEEESIFQKVATPGG